MTIIAYVHGYGSDGTGTTNLIVEGLKKKNNNYEKEWNLSVIRMDYDSTSNAGFCYGYLSGTLQKLFTNNETDILLVGSSLGGFWANYLADTFNLPCILINPVIQPSKLRYNLKGYESFEKPKKYYTPRILIIGRQDNIIDIDETLDYYDNTTTYFLENEGHRLNDFSPVINIILEMTNQYTV